MNKSELLDIRAAIPDAPRLANKRSRKCEQEFAHAVGSLLLDRALSAFLLAARLVREDTNHAKHNNDPPVAGALLLGTGCSISVKHRHGCCAPGENELDRLPLVRPRVSTC